MLSLEINNQYVKLFNTKLIDRKCSRACQTSRSYDARVWAVLTTVPSIVASQFGRHTLVENNTRVTRLNLIRCFILKWVCPKAMYDYTQRCFFFRLSNLVSPELRPITRSCTFMVYI